MSGDHEIPIPKPVYSDAAWGRVWVVREPDDHGEPIVAICETEEIADEMARRYAIAYPSSKPRVAPYAFDQPPE